MINIITSSRYKVNRKEIINNANNYLNEAGFLETDVLNIIFIGKNKMRAISQKYKKENEALPVLSFKYSDQGDKYLNTDKEKLLGEIFICYPQAVLLAAQREKRVENIILNLIEHGIENIL